MNELIPMNAWFHVAVRIPTVFHVAVRTYAF